MSATPVPQKKIWHVDSCIGQIDTRVDLARMDFYRLLISGRSDEDFYIEEAFNCFLSIAQSPLNFAIYENNKLLFHFANDLKYKNYFTEKLNGDHIKENHTFPFFPQILNKRYKICIFYMNTKEKNKSNWIAPISPNLKNEEESIESDEFNDQSRYLKRCMWRFFIDDWGALNTSISGKVAQSIINSINQISLYFENTGNRFQSEYSESCLAQEDSKIYNDSFTENWHKKLRELFDRTLHDSQYGLKIQTSMMDNSTEINNKNIGNTVSNMMFSYRCFTRKNQRSGWSDSDEGYLYDTQFLVRDKKNGDNIPVAMFFKKLADFSRSNDGISDFQSGHDRNNNSRVLYRDIFNKTSPVFIKGRYKNNKNALNDLKDLAYILDEMFWSFINCNGENGCIEILQSSVGINSRSFVDPVYHTGLIHFNAIFELGGLDRVGKKIDSHWGEKERKDFIDNNIDDLMRIVMFYYLFCEMSDWGGKTKEFNPALLEAVLVPIKMRGSVWAVTMHAAYRKDFKNKNLKLESCCTIVPRWISIYQICSTLRQKNHEMFDKTLWENSQRRVIRLLEKSFEKFPDVKKFKDIVDNFNYLTSLEQRYVPYALPKIVLNKDNYSGGTVKIIGASGRPYDLNWQVVDNPYFVANQPWSRVSTRSFQAAIEIGINRGLAKLANYIEKGDS